MATIERRRADRYVDPEDAFQRLPNPKDGYASTFMHKHVRDLINENFSEIRKLLNEELKGNYIFSTTWINARSRFALLKATLIGNQTAGNLNSGNQIAGGMGCVQGPTTFTGFSYILNAIWNGVQSQPAVIASVQELQKLPDECHIAIIAYTMEVYNLPISLYADFNQKCRGLNNESSWSSFPYKSFFALLSRAIHGVRNKPDVTTETYYRGIIHHRINYLREGDHVFPTQFLSCSVNEKIAQSFMAGAAHATLMEFKGSPLAACGIVDYSDYPSEEEMLVFPWSTFKVTKIQRGGTQDRVFLESVGPCVRDLPYSGKYTKDGANVRN